eukprot:3995725-Amphidinium_carterae.1
MVFPQHLLDPILALERTEDLKTVKAEISELYRNKRSGALLFSSAMKSLVVTEIERIIRARSCWRTPSLRRPTSPRLQPQQRHSRSCLAWISSPSVM